MKKALLPISFLYQMVLECRHALYDKDFLHSRSFDVPVICVGNLSLGGSGKTPLTEYLIRLLREMYGVSTLSRGYGRTTKGFAVADSTSSYQDIGDEPLQYFQKYDGITVAVDEDRCDGIERLIHNGSTRQVILLDDAFQHRKVKAGLNILLTEFDKPYFNDHLLPAGNLRDVKKAARRADIIVVTKSPEKLSEEQMQSFLERIHPQQDQKVFFSYLRYGDLIPINEYAKTTDASKAVHAAAFCGIANPGPLFQHLEAKHRHLERIVFGDHHAFSKSDIERIIKAAQKNEGTILITTEKDAARLTNNSYFCQFDNIPVFAQPIEVRFHQEIQFNTEIYNYVRKNIGNR